MEKEFLPYELALAMKEIGFDERCYVGWYKKEVVYPSSGFATDFNSRKPIEHFVSAPLYQQAFRWFREKYGLHSYIDITCSQMTHDWGYNWDIRGRGVDDWWFSQPENQPAGEWIYATHEEAELACLRKLIEIVK